MHSASDLPPEPAPSYPEPEEPSTQPVEPASPEAAGPADDAPSPVATEARPDAVEPVLTDAPVVVASPTVDATDPPVDEQPVPEPPADPSPSLAALEIEIASVRRDLDKANARLDLQVEETSAAQRRADEHAAVARRQTEMADELHAENRTLRQGEIAKALDPLIRGIARFADDLDKIGLGEPTSDDVAHLRTRVDELLHDAGITQLRPALGEPFDPQSQQAAGTVPTADRALDRSIAEVRRTGLRRDDARMLRPTEVVVHRYVAPSEPPAPTSQTTDAPSVAPSIEDPA